MIKAVIFDAGGVLHPSNRAVSEDLKQELGLTDDQVTEFFATYLPPLLKGEITETEIWQQAKTAFGIRDVTNQERLLTRAFESKLHKSEDVYAVVNQLKAKNLKVMLLTNVSYLFAEVLERLGHYEPFQYKILSYQVGLAKPDIAIFELALKELDVKPHEAVFIDDQEENVRAAEQLEIHGVIFKDSEQLKRELGRLL